MADKKTFVVHVSVDAESADRAKTLVQDCLDAGDRNGLINSQEDEYAVAIGEPDYIEE